MLSGNAPLLARLVGQEVEPGGEYHWRTAAIEYPLSPVPQE